MRRTHPVDSYGRLDAAPRGATERMEIAMGTGPVEYIIVGFPDNQFNGTTDEIIQWASCKWGFDPDITRANVMVESTFRQTATAGSTSDQAQCPEGLTAPCPLAFGLLQIRADSHPGTYPYSATSTAFNLDYSLAMRRSCYDGNSFVGASAEGDLWGCVGAHFSGKLHDSYADGYIEKVQGVFEAKPWLKW